MRLFYAMGALGMGAMICSAFPDVPHQYHLLAIAIVMAGAMAGGDGK